MKKILSIYLFLLVCNGLNAQVTSNLFLRDGTNFAILKAFDLGNDSVSLLLPDKKCIRIPLVDLYKIVLIENYAKIPDSLTTVSLVTGIKYSAKYAFNFYKGSVNLKLSSGEIKNVPLEMIHEFRAIDCKYYSIEYGKSKLSFGSNIMFSNYYDEISVAPELSMIYLLNPLFNIQVKFGGYFFNSNSKSMAEIENIDYLSVNETRHQLNSNKLINISDIERIERNGKIYGNMYYLGAKSYFYLFGYHLKNYIGAGLHYYFVKENYNLQVESKWIENNRSVSVYDSVLANYDQVSEPNLGKLSLNKSFTRKPFVAANLSYTLKYWISNKSYITNEVGLLIGQMNAGVNVNQKNYYQYPNGNRFEDETYNNLTYSYQKEIPFNQFFVSLSLYFN